MAFRFVVLACTLAAESSFAAGSAPSTPDASAGNATAYQALRVARATLGAEELGRLVEVAGRDGVPQPYLWKIVLKEGANSSKEIDVAEGKIVAQRTLSKAPTSTGVVKLQALNLDSSGAFQAADAQSLKARIRFDSVNYTLRTNDAGQPVWAMELFDQNGAGIGTMRLTATDGTIASIDGRIANAAGRPGEPLTASNAVVPASPPHPVSTTTTVATTTVVPAPVVTEPPPVHDVDIPPPAPPAEEVQGGFFTRAGRTLDHTQEKVAHSLDVAHDNVAHSLDVAHDNVVQGVDTAHAKVDHSLRATGATLERFFTGHTDLDKD